MTAPPAPLVETATWQLTPPEGRVHIAGVVREVFAVPED
jgi:hypothetical protein